MKLLPTAIPEVVVIEPRIFEDDRGFFLETWNERTYCEAGISAKFVQDNRSYSVRGTLRGLHYQVEQTQGKLVTVLAGEVFDVAVDVRRSSATFGKWVGVQLSATNRRQVWIPPGFAHGFLVTGDCADVLYKCTDFYSPTHERTILWDDRTLDVTWPLLADERPILSEKDRRGARFGEAAVLD